MLQYGLVIQWYWTLEILLISNAVIVILLVLEFRFPATGISGSAWIQVDLGAVMQPHSTILLP